MKVTYWGVSLDEMHPGDAPIPNVDNGYDKMPPNGIYEKCHWIVKITFVKVINWVKRHERKNVSGHNYYIIKV